MARKQRACVNFYLSRSKLSVHSNFRVNEMIRVAEVRLIGPNNENIGVVPIQQALQIARDADLDLVEVAPNSEPPVCRVMDFGKFLFEGPRRKKKPAKLKQKSK